MRTRECVAWGAIIGMVLTMFTLHAVTRGPAPDTAGEATCSVLGVVVDRVVIPPDPIGNAGLPTDRIMKGVLYTMIGAAFVSGCIGGIVGWAFSAAKRRQKQAGNP